MPELDLSDLEGIDMTNPEPLAPSLGRTLAAAKLISVMTWPDDETARNQFMATLAALAPSKMSPLPLTDLQGPISRAIAEAIVQPFINEAGGNATLANAPGVDALNKAVEKAWPKWRWVGQILQYIVAIEQTQQGTGSVHKAVFLIEKNSKLLNKKGQQLSIRTRIMDAWREYKSVSHLCSAILHLTDAEVYLRNSEDEFKDERIDSWFPFKGGLHVTLAHARDFQLFATTFVPHGQKKPLLEPATLWCLPEEGMFPLPAGREYRPLILSDDDREKLAEYCAPQAY
ncbi:MAG: hypothetical protein H7840_17380 [Alphaproteobacteria bacterium]